MLLIETEDQVQTLPGQSSIPHPFPPHYTLAQTSFGWKGSSLSNVCRKVPSPKELLRDCHYFHLILIIDLFNLSSKEV